MTTAEMIYKLVVVTTHVRMESVHQEWCKECLPMLEEVTEALRAQKPKATRRYFGSQG
jgi:hypothetical protein